MEFSLPQISLPVAKIPQRPDRPAQDNIPPTLEQRRQIQTLAREYVESENPVPPIPIPELQVHAEKMLGDAGLDLKYVEYAAVIMNNEVWRDTLATIPYERRLLLLPKCLRVEASCPAPFDEFGLLCKSCGNCSLQDLQEEAERLGYAVLIAEGSAIVMSIIETGKIQAIVGVSCLSVLERAFPYMEAAAIPGVAIPLLQDDCADTNVDLDWVWEVMHLTSEDKTYRMDLDALRADVQTWFEESELDRLMGPVQSETEQIARDWLRKDGKRWRPFLTACAYQALQDNPEVEFTDSVKKAAIAVECFHKASLVHDDIEDEDETRYDEATVHAEHGVGVALNVGDLLLGDGYRMIAETDASADHIAKMLQIAAAGHRDLCLGQGAELCWARNPHVLKSTQVLEIFRRKTSPAFEVALRLGAALSGVEDEVHDVLSEYSENLGIAYQIRDDLDDWYGETCNGTADSEAMRPTLMPALGYEKSKKDDKALIKRLWVRDAPLNGEAEKIQTLFESLGVQKRATELYEAYKEQAIRSLRFLEHATLKGLLRRVMGKIFNDLEIKGWCSEFETANAASGKASAEPVA